ncbi:hypothetical protein dqs_0011 [Azoarcus olearius]|uniref:hypothetical protein n=1 Tax=Azoarcus sp. (strain BH72) TaxID=418699 RepID=UPI0008060BB3|nr:hypothetical protein [Azoarcus olearius]ANQ83094.1 hypothetical protein dqs_0011 [Azoarcus olearius]
MSRFTQREERLQAGDREFVVRSIDPINKSVELLDPSTGDVNKMTLAAMRRQLSDGQLRRVTVCPLSGTVRELEQSAKARQTYLFNQTRVQRIEHFMRDGDTKAEAIRRMCAEPLTLNDGVIVSPISIRQAYRLMDAARTSPQELLPAYVGRGNRTARYPDEVERLVRDLIEEEYAKVHSRITLRKLADFATTFAKERELIAEHRRVSRAYVRDILVTHYHGDISHRRLDPRVARAAKHVAQQRIHVDAALQRVEQDTLVLPLIIKTADGNVHQPHLMVCMCCGTAMPLGWLLSLTPVTEEDTFQCLDISLRSKAERFEQLGIDCDIDPFGLFANLYLDNGPENKGKRITQIATVGISITRVAGHSGHRKPFIERLFKSLKLALESLSGFTRFDEKDGTRVAEAEKEALMTFEQAEQWLVRWLYEVWPHTPLDRFVTADYDIEKAPGITPAARWKHYEQHSILPSPPDRTQWVRLRYVTSVRSMSPKTGVPIEGFRFRGDNLRHLIAQYGPDSKVTVYYNPSDYRFAYVADKKTGELLQLVNAEVRASTPAFSFSEAKKRRAHVRASNPPMPESVAAFNSDLAKASVSDASHKRGIRQRQHAIRESAKLDKALQKSRTNPLPADADTDRLPTLMDDCFITEDAIPAFEVEAKPTQPNAGNAR